MVQLSNIFLHSNADLPIIQIMPIIKFHLDLETFNSTYLDAWSLLSWSLPKTWNLWKSIDKSNRWFFPRIRGLTVRKIQNMVLLLIYLGMQSHLWPQLQAPCLPLRSEAKSFRFWGVLVQITILSAHWNWLLIVQKSQEVFSIWNLLDFQSQVPP